MSDTLSRILAYKAEEVAARKPLNPIASLEARASAQEAPRGFEAALRACPPDRYALIAEVKKASPSKGLIREDFDPPTLARAYADGGASCLSVLTDAPSFQGDDAYVAAARAACPLPVLRKEFLVDVWQVAESRALGADAILVIMAAVDDALAADLVAAARHYGMDALVECHDEAETERALRLPVGMIGINNRNLKTFEVSLETTERLSRLVPADRLLVAESGIFTNSDCARLAASRAGAFLVGESLMRKADVTEATRELIAR